jgi:hypothetical protein
MNNKKWCRRFCCIEWSVSRSGRALAPWKGPSVPILQEAGWAPEPVWTQRLEEKSFRLCRGSILDRPVVQLVARHYTDWATRLTASSKACANNRSFTVWCSVVWYGMVWYGMIWYAGAAIGFHLQWRLAVTATFAPPCAWRHSHVMCNTPCAAE